MTNTEISLSLLFMSVFKGFTAFEHFKFRHYLSDSPFRTLSNKPITDCEFECKSRKKCKAFNYRRHVGYCMLLETDFALKGVDAVLNPRKKDWIEVRYNLHATFSNSSTQME